MALRGGEVGDHGQNSSVGVFACGQVELDEHAAYVALDGAFGQREATGDCAVGESLRHQREHLALARGEHLEGVGLAPDERRHDLWVERRAASGDAHGRLEEFGHVENAILEQVADAPSGDEPDGSGRLDVLREDEHPDVRRRRESTRPRGCPRP
jgi:hypothetical protein